MLIKKQYLSCVVYDNKFVKEERQSHKFGVYSLLWEDKVLTVTNEGKPEQRQIMYPKRFKDPLYDYTPLYKFFVKKNNVQDTLVYNELAKTHYKGK